MRAGLPMLNEGATARKTESYRSPGRAPVRRRDAGGHAMPRADVGQDRPGTRPRVGLFVTCLVDAIRPRLGFAAMHLLEQAGCAVEVPDVQTCCGQPAFNSGDTHGGAAIARRVIAAFEGFDYVVAPSGSCAGMIRVHYREALVDDPAWRARAE